MQKQSVLCREGVGPGKEVNRQRAERTQGWRWRREEADGGRLLEAGTGRCRAPTVASSTGLTVCRCPPASRSEAAGDLGSVSVTQREAKLWVSCWPRGAGPGSPLGVPGISMGPGQVPRGLGRLSLLVSLRHPPSGPAGAAKLPSPSSSQPPGTQSPLPTCLQRSVLFWKESGPAWPSTFRGRFPVGCHT